MKHTENEAFSPVRLGVTGGAGCGKSVVCDFLESRGLTVLRADDLARKAVAPGTPAYKKIVDYFGKEALLSDNTLDRRKLRGIITQSAEKKKMLEGFVHPAVFALMQKGFEDAKQKREPVVAVEVPLLFEAGMEGFFDFVVIVTVAQKIRVARLMKRDALTEQEAEALIQIQMPEAEKIARSDFVIDNSGTLAETRKAVDRFYADFFNRIFSKPGA